MGIYEIERESEERKKREEDEFRFAVVTALKEIILQLNGLRDLMEQDKALQATRRALNGAKG